MKFGSKFNEKMYDFRCAEPTEMLCVKAFRWFSQIIIKSIIMKIYAQMGPKRHPKIDIWVIRASIFEVLGGFGRTSIFDEFWDVQKVDQK